LQAWPRVEALLCRVEKAERERDDFSNQFSSLLGRVSAAESERDSLRAQLAGLETCPMCHESPSEPVCHACGHGYPVLPVELDTLRAQLAEKSKMYRTVLESRHKTECECDELHKQLAEARAGRKEKVMP